MLVTSAANTPVACDEVLLELLRHVKTPFNVFLDAAAHKNARAFTRLSKIVPQEMRERSLAQTTIRALHHHLDKVIEVLEHYVFTPGSAANDQDCPWTSLGERLMHLAQHEEARASHDLDLLNHRTWIHALEVAAASCRRQSERAQLD